MKKITNLLLTGALVLGLNSCSPKHEKIGYEARVIKDNGTEYVFEDFNKDTLFEYVTVKKPNEKEIKYARTLLDDESVENFNKVYKTIMENCDSKEEK